MRARSLAIVVLLGTMPLCHGQQLTPPATSKPATSGGGTGSTSGVGGATSVPPPQPEPLVVID